MKKTVSILLMMMLSTSLLAGCQKSETPTEVVNTYFSSIKKSDTKQAQNLIKSTILSDALNEEVSNSSDSNVKKSDKKDTTVDESLGAYLSKVDAKVLSEDVKDNKATVKVQVKAPNYSELLLKVMEESISNSFSGKSVSQKDVEKSLVKKIKASKNETRTGTINLTKKDKEWTIKKDDDITNLLLGQADETESTMYSK